jgi:hypothetical protein
MKKVLKTLVLSLAVTSSSVAFAQNARETSTKFGKDVHNAVVADYDVPVKLITDALKDRLEKEGLGKMKSTNGFMAYMGTLWNSVSGDKLDVYFKVEGKKDKSTITVMVSKGYDNFVTSTSDSITIANIKTFLNNFMDHANAFQLNLDIKAQEDVVIKTEKDLNSIKKDGTNLIEQKEKLEKKIVENDNKQTLKQRDLDEAQKQLNDLKAQRK